MNSRKVGVLVLVGLAFASVLWFLKPAPESKPLPSLPEKNTSVNQQMAIETMPLPQPTPAPQAAIEPVEAIAPTQEVQPVAQIAQPEQPHILSFIQFVGLPENSYFHSDQIDWRRYREYRRAFAQSPQPVN